MTITTRSVLLGLIALLAVLFPAIYAIFQDYLLAVFALGLAAVWLILEIKERQIMPSLFLMVFVGFAVWGSLRGLPSPLMLAGLCLDLAAWDLSRFRARVSSSLDHDPGLETVHVHKLAVIIGVGLIGALIPMLIKLPIHLNFVIFCFLVVLAMLVLRKSALSLRR